MPRLSPVASQSAPPDGNFSALKRRAGTRVCADTVCDDNAVIAEISRPHIGNRDRGSLSTESREKGIRGPKNICAIELPLIAQWRRPSGSDKECRFSA